MTLGSCRTGQHHGPEGRTSPRIVPKKSLTLLLKPQKQKIYLYKKLLHPSKKQLPAGKHHATETAAAAAAAAAALLLLPLLLLHKDTATRRYRDGETAWP